MLLFVWIALSQTHQGWLQAFTWKNSWEIYFLDEQENSWEIYFLHEQISHLCGETHAYKSHII